MSPYPRLLSAAQTNSPLQRYVSDHAVYDRFMSGEFTEVKGAVPAEVVVATPLAEGHSACFTGVLRSSNPHPIGDSNWMDWMDGWDHARMNPNHPTS